MAEYFVWSRQGLNLHHFMAFGNLLALRNGGQVEPTSLREEHLQEEESGNDSDSESIDTSLPQPISTSGHNALKRKFLDYLAEFIANKKGGQSVACSAMKEAEDCVTIWVTRNEGFQDLVNEKKVLDLLAEYLSKISRGAGNETGKSQDLLWDLMLNYQRKRLEGAFIPNLRSSFKECVGLFDLKAQDDLDSALLELSNLKTLVFDVPGTGQKLIDRHKELVTKSFDLRATKSVKELLQTSPHATPKTKRLWGNIYFLARIRLAFINFLKIAKELPSFASVTIYAIAQKKTAQNVLGEVLKLKDVFNLLKIPFNESNIKTVLGPKWTMTKAQKEFEIQPKRKLDVHAEVQMVLFLSRDNYDFKNCVPYFGCSKYSCFMCFHFLRAYGTITTRGCHGRLYKPWTIPEATSLAIGQAERITQAVIYLQEKLQKELRSGTVIYMKPEKTSVVGKSSIFSENDLDAQRRKRELERRQMKAEQERIAEKFQRIALEEEKNSNPLHKRLGRGSSYEDPCDICLQMTSRRCSVCNKGSYCSPDCEEKRTSPHIFECAKRPITTADYLYMSCGMDKIPDDEEVLKDFGFSALEQSDWSYLLGLYQGLRFSVPVEDVHKWQVEGSLVHNIKEHYYKIPEKHRGGYFPWFLKHTDIFDSHITKEGVQERLISTFFDEARTYLDEEDRNLDHKELKPAAKRFAFYLLAEALHRAYPDPIEENWVRFGFSICGNEWEEMELSGLYHRLLLGKRVYAGLEKYIQPIVDRTQGASFTEFWQAYEDGTLIQLMDSKGYKEQRLRFPLLEEFLSVPADDPKPSVWDLKQFLAVNDPRSFPLARSAEFDYGFLNCESFEETCILMEIYKRLLLKANPLALHEACIEGKLFEFAQMFHTMDEGHRRLMKNLYPLEIEDDQAPAKDKSCIVS